MIELIGQKNADFSKTYRNLTRQARYQRPCREKLLEDRIAANISALSPFGFDLELVDRQYVCGPVGRLDLLCYDPAHQRYVVIELKDVKATRGSAVGNGG